MGLEPDWMKKPLKLIEDFPVKRVQIDSSKVHPTLLSIMGYNKYNPAPEKLEGISMPGPGLKTMSAVWL